MTQPGIQWIYVPCCVSVCWGLLEVTGTKNNDGRSDGSRPLSSLLCPQSWGWSQCSLLTVASANIATHWRGKPRQGDRGMELRARVSCSNPGWQQLGEMLCIWTLKSFRYTTWRKSFLYGQFQLIIRSWRINLNNVSSSQIFWAVEY